MHACYFSSAVTGFHLWGAVVATGVVCTFYCTLVCQDHYVSFHFIHLLCEIEKFISGMIIWIVYTYFPSSHIVFVIGNIQSRVKFDPL